MGYLHLYTITRDFKHAYGASPAEYVRRTLNGL